MNLNLTEKFYYYKINLTNLKLFITIAQITLRTESCLAQGNYFARCSKEKIVSANLKEN